MQLPALKLLLLSLGASLAAQVSVRDFSERARESAKRGRVWTVGKSKEDYLVH